MERKDPFRKKYGGFAGFGRKAFGAPRGAKSKFEAAEVKPPDIQDDGFDALIRKLKDPVLAKRVYNLRDQFPDGTVPELVAMDWLNRSQVKYIYQAQYGIRGHRGLVMPDFVIDSNGMGSAWQIQGEYWHTKRKTPEYDRRQRQQILNEDVNGITIKRYVELWESDIYNKNPDVFVMAMAGIQLR